MKTTDLLKNKKWRLLIFHRAMVLFSLALVFSALAAGLYQSRVYFSFGACAAGALLWAKAWLDFCRWRDGKPLERTREKTPYMLRARKKKTVHKPAFLMNASDFDDDLTPWTALGEETLPRRAQELSSVLACVFAGAAALLASLIP